MPVKISGLFTLELFAHAPVIAICCAAMGFAGYISGYLEHESWVAAQVAGTTSPSFLPSAILVLMATLPAVFVVVGMYAIVDASQEALRYELGVYCSQGINGDTVLETWSTLYGWIPVAAYVLGLFAFLFATPGVLVDMQNALPDIVGDLFFITGMATLIIIPSKLNGILEASPYAVVKS